MKLIFPVLLYFMLTTVFIVGYHQFISTITLHSDLHRSTTSLVPESSVALMKALSAKVKNIELSVN